MAGLRIPSRLIKPGDKVRCSCRHSGPGRLQWHQRRYKAALDGDSRQYVVTDMTGGQNGAFRLFQPVKIVGRENNPPEKPLLWATCRGEQVCKIAKAILASVKFQSAQDYCDEQIRKRNAAKADHSAMRGPPPPPIPIQC